MTRVEAPEEASHTHLTDKPTGAAVLEVTVLMANRSPAIGSIVTVVALPLPGTPESEWTRWGPIQHKEVKDASGVVNFSNLPDGARACVHVRSDIALSTAKHQDLYPAPLGTVLQEPTGDPTQAPVLTGANRRAVPFTPANYLAHCVKSPPLTLATQGSHTKITLQHNLAVSLDIKVLDLLGKHAPTIQRGVVAGGYIVDKKTPVFTCEQIPWLKYDDLCDTDEVPPGFLISHRATPGALSVAQGIPFRVEALDNVKVNGNDVELVATQGVTGVQAINPVLVGENLVCRGGSKPEDHIIDAVGDATAMDIQDTVKFSIGVDYGVQLKPDLTRTTVWFDMTAHEGTVLYRSRTVLPGNQTRTFSMEFSATREQNRYVCEVTSQSGQLYDLNDPLSTRADVYCDHNEVEEMVRVTIIQRNIPPWVDHQFSLRTNPVAGNGDVVPTPDRSDASRAFVSIRGAQEEEGEEACTVRGGNDDRLAIRI